MAIIKFGNKEVEISGIIFDKDGTLIDFKGFWGLMTMERVKNMLNHPYVKAQNLEDKLKEYFPAFYGFTKDGRIKPFSILAQAGYQDSLASAATVLYQHGLEWIKAKEVATDAYKLADEKIDYAKHFQPLPFAEEVIQNLAYAGLKLGLASMDTIKRSRYCLELLKVEHLIPYVLGPEKIKNPKPHPEFVNSLCHEMGLMPSEVVVIGDGLNDIIMGKKAGVKLTVGVTTGVETRERLQSVADVVIDSLNEIKVISGDEVKIADYNQNNFALIYVDGASQGNPGPAGAGVVFKDRNGETIDEISRFIGKNTNNFAEYTALTIAVETALRKKYKSIEIRSDSELVVKQIKGEYKVKQPVLQQMHAQVRKLLDNFASWTIIHVPREQNKRADELATAAINKTMNQ